MNKRLICAALLILIVILPGCGSNMEVNFSQLITNADKYNGKVITLECFYFDAFEMMALCESLKNSDTTPGRLTPQGELIWLEGGLPGEIHDRLYSQPIGNASGYPEHYGKIRITGRFESSGKYGHLDSYEYQLTFREAQLLGWSPPPAQE